MYLKVYHQLYMSGQFYFIPLFILFLERKEGRGREKHRKTSSERNIDRLPPAHAPTRDRTRNLGKYCAWELNPRPFSLLEDALLN